MATATASPTRPGKDGLATFLGGFSFALGAPQIAAPRRFDQAIGAPEHDRALAVTRFVGAREVAAGTGILATRTPGAWLWARVAGDVIDLALLGSAMKPSPRRGGLLRLRRGRETADRRRLAIAGGAAAGALALDLVAAIRHTRRGVAADEAAHASAPDMPADRGPVAVDDGVTVAVQDGAAPAGARSSLEGAGGA